MIDCRSKELNIKISFFSILILLVSLFYRYAINDEGWLGEHAYFLGSEGVVKSEMFSGFRNSEIQIFNYHKIHTWFGGILIKLFGLNLYLLKGISLVSLMVLYRYFYKFFKNENRNQIIYLAFSLLLINNHMLTYGFVYRPELLSTTFGFLSFYHLMKPQNNKLYLSALFAGLAGVSHLNGLIFIVTGILFLVSKKSWFKSVQFILFSGIAFSIYFVDIIIPKNNIDTFLVQFSSLEPKISIIQKVISEHFRMFHSPKEIILFFMFFFISIIPLIRKRIKLSNNIKYILILGGVFILVTPNKTDKYLVFLIPFLITLISICLDNLYKFYTKSQKRFAHISFILYGLINVIASGQLIAKNCSFVQEQNQIVDKILDDSPSSDPKVDCDLLFMYNKGIKKLNLKGVTYYQYKYRDTHKVFSYKWDNVFKDMFNDERAYIVLSKKTMKSHKYKPELYTELYNTLFETDSYIILKRL
ncbi:MAG: hypothetical protein ACPGSD_13860 [Flavobacteriales bacterium]